MIEVSTCRAVVVAFLAAATVVGCSANSQEPASDGPLVVDQGPGEICLSGEKRADATQGQEVLKNTGNKVVTLTGITLTDAVNVELREAFIVPLGDQQTIISSWSRWPPSHTENSGPDSAWRKRKDASGFQLGPAAKSNGTDFNLVTHFARINPASEGRFASIKIDYTVGEDRYYTTSKMRVAVKPACS